MGRTLLRALVFALGLVAVSLAIDLATAALYQGAMGREFVVFRMALHGATFVFTALGAGIGFGLVGPCSIATARVASLGAAITGIRLGAYWAILAWLIAGSALAAYFGAKVLGSKDGS